MARAPLIPKKPLLIAKRELKAAFAKRIVTHRLKDPGRICGRFEGVIHHSGSISCRPVAEPPVDQCVDGNIVQARHHQIRPCGPQLGRVLQSGYTERGHAAGAGCLDAGGRVLDDEAVCGRNVQFRGGEQKNFRVRLALPQIATADISGEDFEQTPAGVRWICRIIWLAFFEEDATAMGHPSAPTA